eukprot:TRINITY_DN34387_c0_g1_i1.p1 TRINITY_DN34387_c0_g1~~TRINITY_DN34387_c0_g1_i1.p1  ORF type:complete len:258 (-),score=36.39 TRINITY_DN34387_c0_g1_i1:248-988(-)
MSAAATSCASDFSKRCLLVVLGFCLAWAPTGALDPEAAASLAGPCLCVFDVDRTLTGRQDLIEVCPRNKVFPGVKDNGLFNGRPPYYGNFTASELLLGLSETFCHKCYLGIASTGMASGNNQKMLLLDLIGSALTHEAADLLPRSWTKVKANKPSEPPLVLWCQDKSKHLNVREIVRWYAHRGVHFSSKDVFFFDDKAANILSFKSTDYNARQISCASRNGTVGLCGGTPAEVVAAPGVFLCGDEQ